MGLIVIASGGFGYLTIGLVMGLGFLVVLVLDFRNRRVAAIPACPKCLYCVEGIEGTTCPECGNDLGASGVLSRRHRPRFRRNVAIIVGLLSVVIAVAFAGIGQSAVDPLAEVLFGRTTTYSEWCHMRVKLKPEASRFGVIEVRYPGDVNQASEIEWPPLGDAWSFPQPVLITVSLHGGGSRDLWLLPEADDDEHPVGPAWTLQETTSGAITHVGAGSGGVVAEVDLETAVHAWLQSLQASGARADDPGPAVGGGMANAVVRQAAFPTSSTLDFSAFLPDAPPIWSERQARVGSQKAPNAHGLLLATVLWFVACGVVVAVVLIPRVHRQPWLPETSA